jgi:predicted amidohydrolase YtcJ
MNTRVTRRHALLGSAAFVAVAPVALAQRKQAAADVIWTGGPIYTMNDAAMRVEAVAARGGRIVAAGPAAEVMRLRGARTRVVDLAGRAMVPGFVDPHGHIVLGGLQAMSANLLAPPDGEVTDIASLQKVLRDWMAANAQAVAEVGTIIGFGYDNAQLKELRHPTRDDLDAVSRDLPILVLHQSGHLGAMNSKALELTGVTADTADPPGGVIRRKVGSREPDGVLEETALSAHALKIVATLGKRGIRAFAKAGAELWARYGYTTAQEGRSTPAITEVLKAIAAENGFRNDVAVFVDVQTDRDDYIAKNHSRSYGNRLRVAGGKLSLDGSPQGFTAYRDRPYYDPVGDYPPGYRGYLTLKEDEIMRLVDRSFAQNVPLINHANGEGASDVYIAALRAATARHGKADRRPVLIHGQFLREDQLDAYKELGVIPALFPMHTYYWGDWHRDHVVGPRLADDISPTGWARQRGMIFTTHHDAPVAFPDSMRVLDATVTRRTRSGDILGPWQRVDVITALKAMTIWAAYQHFEERDKGSIEVGKLADLVVLSEDPTAIPPDDIEKIKVVETIKEGATIYALTAAEQRRAQLSLPASGRQEPFRNFLDVASAHREFLRSTGPFTPRSPQLLQAIASRPHEPGCIHQLLFDLLAQMQA